jgi:hypothetical protein
MSGGSMQPHIRAIVVASAHAFVIRKKVAGLYDHTAARHLRIAAEALGEHLQGYDGDRDARFGGSLPDLHDAREGTSVHIEIEGDAARGYDRGSAGHFSATVSEQRVQLYDHAEGTWFSFEVQTA